MGLKYQKTVSKTDSLLSFIILCQFNLFPARTALKACCCYRMQVILSNVVNQPTSSLKLCSRRSSICCLSCKFQHFFD